MISAGFALFILTTSNPFERLWPAAADGRDLNPLLQDPALAIHPPMLYIGYVGLSVPFAFAVAAMLEGKLDSLWARWVRPWTTVAWMFLTVGIALGSWWAYYELGWGGWWFWDPVENASFMPWLVGTALIHSLAVTEKRGLFKSWTLLLAITAFSLSLLGTFLVRSGVIESVHAFASDPARGLFILAFLAICVGGALVLYAWRAPLFRVERRLRADLARIVPAAEQRAAGRRDGGDPARHAVSDVPRRVRSAARSRSGRRTSRSLFLIPMLPLVFLLAPGMHAAWKRASFERTKKLLGVLLLAAIVLGIAHSGVALRLAFGTERCRHRRRALGRRSPRWSSRSSGCARDTRCRRASSA